MKHLNFVGALAVTLALAATPSVHLSAQAPKAAGSLATVRLSKAVTANGQPLPAGTYQVRLSSDQPPDPGVGQSPDSERYIEFVKAGKVVGKEVATIVSNADIGTIAKGRKPAVGSASVEMLKGNDYLRVWINSGGTNYIIHLPITT
jgi:hypothetical protein